MSPSGPAAAVLVLVGAVALRAGVAGVRRARPTRRVAALVAPSARPATGRNRSRPRPPAWFRAGLDDVGVTVRPERAWLGWLGAAAGGCAWALAGAGPGAAVLVAAALACGPWVGWRALRHRGAAGIEAVLPSAVDAVAAGLRSGASLRQAIGEAARVTPGALGADLAAVSAATERGAGVVAALEAWADRRPLPGVRLVAAALCLSVETGGAAARAVDAVATTLRQRLAAQAEARALATQARSSAAVMAVAPVAFCALSTAIDPRSSAFLLRTPVGLALLAAGLALDAAGALWMARLTRLDP